MPPRPATDTPSPASSSSSLPYSHFAAQMDKLSIEPRESASSSSPSSSARASPAIGPSTNPYAILAQGRHSRKPSEISTSTSSSSSSSATPLPPPSSSRSASSLNIASAHPKLRREAGDFEFGDSLGEGSYSTVVAARDKHTGSWYAIKIEEKQHIIKEKKIKYVEIEKNTLNRMNHPGIVRLYWTFQDKDSLYFVLDLARNGELLTYIKKLGAFDMPATQFYAAEILSAIEHVHSKGVIHRDVKPENILLDENMHIKLTDFGSAKILEASESGSSEPERANSFVGTAEYVSPELLTDKSACKASDFWALGCIIYQLLAGRPPFKGANEYQTFQKIIKLEYSFPESFPDVARDLVSRLLVLDPVVRLGAPETGGTYALKNHPFFNGINWAGLFDSPAPKLHPYLPKLAEHNDTELRSKNEIFMRKSLEGKARDPFREDEVEDLGEERARKLKEQAESPWASFLLKNELILRVGPVHKRKGLFNKKRVLILTDKPRLLYLDQEKMVQKGEIFWTPRMVPELKGRKHFFVHTPNKTYYFEDPEGKAKEWVDEVNRTLLDNFGPTG